MSYPSLTIGVKIARKSEVRLERRLSYDDQTVFRGIKHRLVYSLFTVSLDGTLPQVSPIPSTLQSPIPSTCSPQCWHKFDHSNDESQTLKTSAPSLNRSRNEKDFLFMGWQGGRNTIGQSLDVFILTMFSAARSVWKVINAQPEPIFKVDFSDPCLSIHFSLFLCLSVCISGSFRLPHLSNLTFFGFAKELRGLGHDTLMLLTR